MSQTLTAHERSALQSKKFWAYFIAEMTGKAALLYEIHHGSADWVVVTTLVILGFIAVTFIGGQAALDKYVRLAEIGSRVGSPSDSSPPTE